MNQNNKYIGTIIKGDRIIRNSNKKVIFKVNDQVYIKKIKERNKLRQRKYSIAENINIICNDLNKDYVYVYSDNRPYFNKILLVLNIFLIFFCMFMAGVTLMFYEKLFILSLLSVIGMTSLLIIYLFYTVLVQPKKLYKNYTETVEGEIIDYIRTENRHYGGDILHCHYNIMYKYKTKEGKIIHSVSHRYNAELLYKNYPIGKRVLIKYNPLKCCESCLLDEYNSIYNGEKFVKEMPFIIKSHGKITNIITRCIDDEVDEYLKPTYLVDYIECEYNISQNKYKTFSIFAVPHNRFKLNEEIIIFYEKDNPNNFLCDINRKYSKYDKIDF